MAGANKKLTPEQIKEAERKEKRDAFIKEHYDEAEKAAREGKDVPDVVYDFQRQDVYSADPLMDKQRQAISDHKTLPVKQFNVMEDGSWGITLDEGSGALEELRAGKFCHACLDRQPDMPELWEHIVTSKLEATLGPRPEWARHGTMCCYCGARLGVEGKHEEPALRQTTPEQMKLLEQMFGKIRV